MGAVESTAGSHLTCAASTNARLQMNTTAMTDFTTQLTCLCGHRIEVDAQHPDAYKLIISPESEDAVEQMSDDPAQVRELALQLCKQSKTVLHCPVCGRYHISDGKGGFAPYAPEPHDINFQTPSGYHLKNLRLQRIQMVVRQAMVGRLPDGLRVVVMRCPAEHVVEIRYYFDVAASVSADPLLESAVAQALRAHWPITDLKQYKLQCSSASDVALHDGDILIYRG